MHAHDMCSNETKLTRLLKGGMFLESCASRDAAVNHVTKYRMPSKTKAVQTIAPFILSSRMLERPDFIRLPPTSAKLMSDIPPRLESQTRSNGPITQPWENQLP